LTFWCILPDISTGKPLFRESWTGSWLFRIQDALRNLTAVNTGLASFAGLLLLRSFEAAFLGNIWGGDSGMKLVTVRRIFPDILTRKSVLEHVWALFETFRCRHWVVLFRLIFGE
jgi:hypothetical protein